MPTSFPRCNARLSRPETSGPTMRALLLLLFYGLLTPVALLLRAVGVDVMHRRLDARATSYWQERRP
jgi:hypothetical protein